MLPRTAPALSAKLTRGTWIPGDRCPRGRGWRHVPEMTMTVEVRVRRLAALGNDAIGAGLMTTAFGPGGRLTGPLGGESRAGRDPGTVRWRACGTSQPAWSPPGGRRRGGRGGRRD